MIIVISIIYVHVVLIFRTIMNRGFGLVLFGTDVHTSICPRNHYGVEGRRRHVMRYIQYHPNNLSDWFVR